MLRHCLLSLAIAAIAAPAAALEPPATLPRSAAPAGASVYIISPADGERVKGPFVVRFGLSGMGVAPAGVELEHTGHHHILVDQKKLPPDGQPVPRDAHHLHFGDGQTETTLTLPPGKHSLQLLLADHLHIPHQPPVVSKRITVVVE